MTDVAEHFGTQPVELKTRIFEVSSRGFNAVVHPCPKDQNDLMIQFVPRTEIVGIVDPEIVKQHLEGLFPSGTKVSFVAPQPEWKIKMTSMKILGVLGHWAFDITKITDALPDLLEELSTKCRKGRR